MNPEMLRRLFEVERRLDDLVMPEVPPVPDLMIADAITLNNGNSADGIADLQTLIDGNVYAIAEVAGVPGIDLEVAFANITTISAVFVRCFYVGAANHAVRIQLYNYVDVAWDTISTAENENDFHQHNLRIPDDADYISAGAAIVRFYHTENGNAAHDHYIDFVGLAE